MLRSPHFIAAVLTILALFVFLVLRKPLDFQFGLRTYWPAFLCAYLLVWYYSKTKKTQ